MGDTLDAELASWLIPDPQVRAEKFRRERIRHHKLLRDLKLDVLGTEEMQVLEVGGGPMPVSDLLRFRSRVVVDPLSTEYASVIPCPDHQAAAIEGWEAEEPGHGHFLHRRVRRSFDLVIATNSLDHVEDPHYAFLVMEEAVTERGYIAIAGAENNAITHPHEAHVHNLTADTIHRWADEDFETVWELTYARDGYRYGWVPYEGKRGQPAFALLLRRC